MVDDTDTADTNNEDTDVDTANGTDESERK